MRNFTLYAALLITILTLPSCARWYSVSPDFEEVSINHRTLAVLPFEVVMSGRMPNKMTQEQVFAIEEAEGLAFQISMHDEILRSLKNGRYNLTVRLLSVQETNARLAEIGLDVYEIHQMSPRELCKLLNVDAVYLGRIEKNRFLTDLESFGIDLADDLVFLLSRGNFWLFTDPTAQDIFVQGSILEGTYGQSLFTAQRGFSVDWTNPSNQIIRNINYQIAKKIPYRQKGR